MLKIKKINFLLILIFLILCSTTISIAAEIRFDIPTDYEVTSTNSTCSNLVNTQDSRITITIVDAIQLTTDEIINNLLNSFDTKVEETNTHLINGKNVTENVLDIPDGTNSKFYIYTFESNDHIYTLTIASTDYTQWNVEDKKNPVNIIISSLTLSSPNKYKTTSNSDTKSSSSNSQVQNSVDDNEDEYFVVNKETGKREYGPAHPNYGTENDYLQEEHTN